MIQSVDVLGVCPPEVSRKVREISVIAMVHVQAPNRIVFFKFCHAVLPFFYAEILHYLAPVVRGLHWLSDAFSVHVENFMLWIISAEILQRYERWCFFCPRLLIFNKCKLSIRFQNRFAVYANVHELACISQARINKNLRLFV